MSQIRKLFLLVIPLLLAILSLAGCGDNNPQTNYDPVTGSHPSGWLPFGHAAAVRAHGDVGCTDCHGPNWQGGISKVSCTQVGCHLGSHTLIHPVGWYGPGETQGHGALAYAAHGSFVRQFDPTGSTCSSVFCHGTSLQGGSGPSCSSCHIGGPFQVHPWSTNAFDTTQDFSTTPPQHALFSAANPTIWPTRCANAVCHGPRGQGVPLSGGDCRLCHINGAPGLGP